MLGTMNKHQNENYNITVFDDSNHKFGFIENKFNYSKYYFCESEVSFPVSRLGIKVFYDKKEVANSIVIGFAGEQDVYTNSYLIDCNQPLICCCDTVICLSIPTLEVNWKKSFDKTLCLRISKQNKDYLIYGKNQVIKIDLNGNIKQNHKSKNDFVSFDDQSI